MPSQGEQMLQGCVFAWVLVSDTSTVVKISPSVQREATENLNTSWRTAPVC